MFAGSKFCPHCGAATEQVSIGEQTQRACPECDLLLSRISIGRFPCSQCLSCGGLWMSPLTLDAIAADADARTAARGMVIPGAEPPASAHHYLNCPTCAQLMNKHVFAQASGVILSVCRNHGVWLHRGQLNAIMDFIIAGGLERAKRTQLERLAQERRKIDEMRREVERRERGSYGGTE